MILKFFRYSGLNLTHMRTLVTIVFVSFFICSTSAQSAYSDRTFEVGANHRMSGWQIGVGASTIWASDLKQESFLENTSETPIEYLTDVDGKGKVGLYVEVGRFNIFEHGFFDFMDYGIAYRQETGEEVMSASLVQGSDVDFPSLVAGEGTFSQDHVRAHFNLNKAIPLNGHFFVTQSIGIDFEYRVIDSAPYIHNTAVLDSAGVSPFNVLSPEESFSGHIHYKAGIGYKTGPASWLIFSAETPLQTILPFEGVKSRQDIFNTKYRPVVLSLKYMWASRRPDRTCSPSKAKQKNLKRKAKRRKGAGGVKNGQLN